MGPRAVDTGQEPLVDVAAQPSAATHPAVRDRSTTSSSHHQQLNQQPILTDEGAPTPSLRKTKTATTTQIDSIDSDLEDGQHKPAAPAATTAATAAHPSAPHGKRAQLSIPKKFLVWWPELVAAALAVALLVIEVVLLSHYDNKMLLIHWPHDWQINAVFAFLTALLEACLTFYVGACIGQLRWHWYRKKAHSLEWLDLMTEARQPSGATRLLLRKGAHKQFAIIGAFIVVLLVGVSTFTQNVIVHVNDDIPWGAYLGGIPTNTNYTWFTPGSTLNVSDQKPLPQMVAATELGLYTWSEDDTGATVINRITSWCDGNVCDFGTYQTLAVCSACSAPVEADNPCPGGGCSEGDAYSLDGVVPSLTAIHGVVNVTSDTQYPRTADLRDSVGPLIARMDAMIADDAFSPVEGQGASNLECAAWWCVKTFSGKIVNGTITENLVSEWTNRTEEAKTTYLQNEDIYLTPPECWHNNTTPRNDSFCTYIAGAKTQAGFQNFITGGESNLTDDFVALLTGSATYSGNGDNRTWDYTSLLAGGLTATSADEASLTDKLTRGFETMAKYMTVSIREQVTKDGASQYTYGNATVHEIVFHVEWGWLAYPVSLVALSLVFLVGTMIMSRDEEAWKGSTLAMVFHAFDDADRAGYEREYELDSAEGMRRFVRQKKARLMGQDGRLLFKESGAGPSGGWGGEVGQGAAGGVGQFGSAGAKFYDSMG